MSTRVIGLEEFFLKVDRTVYGLGGANPKAVGAACQVYKNAIFREVARDVGPERRIRNWGSSNIRQAGGLKIGARYDVKGKANAVGLVKGTPPGAWKALEYGTQAHVIGLGKNATARLVTYALSGGPNKRARGQLRSRQRKMGVLFANSGPGSTAPRSGAYSHPIARPVTHPGAKGKKTFTRAVRSAERTAITAYQNTIWREGFTSVWR